MGVSVKQGKLWGRATRPGREIRWAEREDSEKRCRPGLSRAPCSPLRKGLPISFATSDPSWVYWPGTVESNRKENIVGLPKTKYLEEFFSYIKIEYAKF